MIWRGEPGSPLPRRPSRLPAERRSGPEVRHVPAPRAFGDLGSPRTPPTLQPQLFPLHLLLVLLQLLVGELAEGVRGLRLGGCLLPGCLFGLCIPQMALCGLKHTPPPPERCHPSERWNAGEPGRAGCSGEGTRGDLRGCGWSRRSRWPAAATGARPTSRPGGFVPGSAGEMPSEDGKKASLLPRGLPRPLHPRPKAPGSFGTQTVPCSSSPAPPAGPCRGAQTGWGSRFGWGSRCCLFPSRLLSATACRRDETPINTHHGERRPR